MVNSSAMKRRDGEWNTEDHYRAAENQCSQKTVHHLPLGKGPNGGALSLPLTAADTLLPASSREGCKASDWQLQPKECSAEYSKEQLMHLVLTRGKRKRRDWREEFNTCPWISKKFALILGRMCQNKQARLLQCLAHIQSAKYCFLRRILQLQYKGLHSYVFNHSNHSISNQQGMNIQSFNSHTTFAIFSGSHQVVMKHWN